MIFITCRERERSKKRASAGKGGGPDRGQGAVSAAVNSGKLFNAPNELLYFLLFCRQSTQHEGEENETGDGTEAAGKSVGRSEKKRKLPVKAPKKRAAAA